MAEEQAVDLLVKWDSRIDALGAKIADLAHQYGPQVADTVLGVARVDAASVLVKGAVAAAVAVGLLWIVRRVL
ncbi:MAG TPA: hypothetical protein VFJ18_03210, partial [Pararhizobium sp.]|nr:hypothetical protein [Pararhizobium sp.]